MADLRHQFRDQSAEFNSVKVELAQIKYHKDESRDLQKQQSDVEEVTKVSFFQKFLLVSYDSCFSFLISLKG